MTKIILVLFLCLSSQIFSIPPAKTPRSYTGVMSEYTRDLDPNHINSYEFIQNDLERDAILAVVKTYSSIPGVSISLALKGSPFDTQESALALEVVNQISTAASDSSSFSTAALTTTGAVYLINTKYKLSSKSLPINQPQITGMTTDQIFKDAKMSAVKLLAFINAPSRVTAIGFDSVGHLALQAGPIAKLNDSPVTIYSEASLADLGSPLHTSYSEKYITGSYTSVGDGIIVLINKQTSKIEREIKISNSNAPQTFTQDNGSITVLLKDPSNNLIFIVLNTQGDSIFSTAIASDVVEYHFSANNAGWVVSYRTGSNSLFYSTAIFDLHTIHHPSSPMPYPISGTKPYSQYLQRDTFCVGCVNGSNQHQTFYKSTNQSTVSPIYTSSGQASPDLNFSWTFRSSNNAATIEQRGFISPLAGNQQLNIGITSSYHPTDVLNSVRDTFNKVKSQ